MLNSESSAFIPQYSSQTVHEQFLCIIKEICSSNVLLSEVIFISVVDCGCDALIEFWDLNRTVPCSAFISWYCSNHFIHGTVWPNCRPKAVGLSLISKLELKCCITNCLCLGLD